MIHVDAFSAELRSIATRIEALKDPRTLAGAQAELERQMTLLEGHVVDMRREIDQIPARMVAILKDQTPATTTDVVSKEQVFALPPTATEDT